MTLVQWRSIELFTKMEVFKIGFQSDKYCKPADICEPFFDILIDTLGTIRVLRFDVEHPQQCSHTSAAGKLSPNNPTTFHHPSPGRISVHTQRGACMHKPRSCLPFWGAELVLALHRPQDIVNPDDVALMGGFVVDGDGCGGLDPQVAPSPLQPAVVASHHLAFPQH